MVLISVRVVSYSIRSCPLNVDDKKNEESVAYFITLALNWVLRA